MTIDSVSRLESSEIRSDVGIEPSWQTVAARRKADINSAIPPGYVVSPTLLQGRSFTTLPETSGILTARELSIVSSTAIQLLKSIHDRALTSVEVTTAFCKSAAIAHQVTNCLAWVMFEQALQDAAELDAYMSVHKKPKGPLHGLPISVKEHIYLKGTPSTSGFIAWADDFCKRDEDEALVVKLLRDAGAVFHVKTTNPQGLMALETVSNLYGTTTNPHNTDLSPGGSSGGESALIAMRGSVLGIGTDIGGSIRIPAAFCGIFGLKPSVARLPHGGLSGAHTGMENIVGAVGPLATNLADLSLFCDVLLSKHPWRHEPSLIPLPWTAVAPTSLPSRLKIGVIRSDNIVLPHPPVTRCMEETIQALTAAGHEIFEWDTTLHRELVECVDQMYFQDAGKEYYDIMNKGGEQPVDLLKWILERESSKNCSADETWKLNAKRNRLQTLYAQLWNTSDADILLCPSNPSAASAHGESTYWGYTSVWNILDYSVVVLPLGQVKVDDAWAELDKDGTGGGTAAANDGYWGVDREGAEKYEGAKVALQLVGRRLQEERVLAVAAKIMQDLETLGA